MIFVYFFGLVSFKQKERYSNVLAISLSRAELTDNIKWVFDAEALRGKKESDNKILMQHVQKID